MTGTDLAVRDRERSTVVLDNDQLRYIANTDFVPKPIRGNLPAILATVAAGRAVGIDDMSALRTIHIVDGRPTFAAELMVMLVRRAGHSITGSVAEGQATIKGRRADNGDEMDVVWTLEMAKRAGLSNKNNWKQYPEAMLWARAVSQLCRMLFADCFIGGTYTAEELGDDDQVEGEAVDEEAGGEITAPMMARLWAIAREHDVSRPWVYQIAWDVAKVDSLKKLTRGQYDAVVTKLEESDGIPFDGSLTEGDGEVTPHGDSGTPAPPDEPAAVGVGEAPSPSASELAARIRELGAQLGAQVDEPLARHEGDVGWLQRQVAKMEQAVAERQAESESLFKIPETART